MIRIQNIWGALVLGACLMSGCAVDSGGRGAEPLQPAPDAMPIVRRACPAGMVKVCIDRLPSAQSCSCNRQEIFQQPPGTSMRGPLR